MSLLYESSLEVFHTLYYVGMQSCRHSKFVLMFPEAFIMCLIILSTRRRWHDTIY